MRNGMGRVLWIALAMLALALPLLAAEAVSGGDAPILPTEVVFKKIGDVELRLHVFRSPASGLEPASAIVFFFGGGWVNGSPEQFYPQCEYFAGRGMVAVSAEYRVKSRHGTSAVECVKDGKSAIRYVRAHAIELGVDPRRIVAAGGSAGGHIAACTGMIEGFEDAADDQSVSSRPCALVLFNPALDIPEGHPLAKLFEGQAAALSPLRHVGPGAPPTIIFHGSNDAVVPFESVVRFRDAMRQAGNVCELVPFEGKGHGFFNLNNDPEAYRKTVEAADRFLVGRAGPVAAFDDAPGRRAGQPRTGRGERLSRRHQEEASTRAPISLRSRLIEDRRS